MKRERREGRGGEGKRGKERGREGKRGEEVGKERRGDYFHAHLPVILVSSLLLNIGHHDMILFTACGGHIMNHNFSKNIFEGRVLSLLRITKNYEEL